MDKIKNLHCLPATILCMAGSDSENNNLLLLVACGNCSVVLNITPVNTPHFHNGVYWYYTREDGSIGYAPNATITQASADNFDYNNNQRVSWDIDGTGGWRLGSLTSIDRSSRYYKVFLKKDF